MNKEKIPFYEMQDLHIEEIKDSLHEVSKRMTYINFHLAELIKITEKDRDDE